MRLTEGPTHEQQEVERLLAGLRTAPLQLSPERLMFVAGQRSARRKLRMWQSIAAVLLLSIGLSIALRPTASERMVYVTREQSTSAPALAARTSPPCEHSYLRLRDRMLQGTDEESPQTETAPAPGMEPTPWPGDPLQTGSPSTAHSSTPPPRSHPG